MVEPVVRLHSPISHKSPGTNLFVPKQIPDLKGKTVALVDNAWWIWEQTLDALSEALVQRYGAAKTMIVKVPRAGIPPEGTLERVEKEADCAILSLAFGGPELVAELDNALVLAKAGLPVMCVVCEINHL